jgi:hypothetical protein
VTTGHGASKGDRWAGIFRPDGRRSLQRVADCLTTSGGTAGDVRDGVAEHQSHMGMRD